MLFFGNLGNSFIGFIRPGSCSQHISGLPCMDLRDKYIIYPFIWDMHFQTFLFSFFKVNIFKNVIFNYISNIKYNKVNFQLLVLIIVINSNFLIVSILRVISFPGGDLELGPVFPRLGLVWWCVLCNICSRALSHKQYNMDRLSLSQAAPEHGVHHRSGCCQPCHPGWGRAGQGVLWWIFRKGILKY